VQVRPQAYYQPPIQQQQQQKQQQVVQPPTPQQPYYQPPVRRSTTVVGWNCNVCTYKNTNLSALACGMCGKPKTAPRVEAKHVWSCKNCTYDNTFDSLKCTICQSSRPTSF
jgi:hypothetical protein